MNAPLTTAALGSTRCVGCEQPFTDDGRQIVEREAEVSDGWGRSPSGQPYRRLGYHTVTRRWHADCLTQTEAWIQQERDRADQDRLDMARAIYDAATPEQQAEMRAKWPELAR